MATEKIKTLDVKSLEIKEAYKRNAQRTDLEIDLDIFPIRIKEYVEVLMLESKCDELSALINTISQLSAIVQKSVKIDKFTHSPIGQGYFECLYPNIWILEVNKSGQFKTTSQRNAHEVAEDLEKIIDLARNSLAELAKNISKYNKSNIDLADLNDIDIINLPKNLSDFEKHIENLTKGFNIKNLSEIINKYDEIIHTKLIKSSNTSNDERKNLSPSYLDKNIFIPTKITFEALLSWLSDNGGGLILSSEFTNWLSVLSGGGKKYEFKSTLTDLYDVPSKFKYTTKKDGEIIISEPFISICGALTDSTFQRFLSEKDIESGFLPRFLLFTPKPSINIPPALPDSTNYQFIAKRKKDLLDYIRDIPDNIHYTLDDDAKKYFSDVHDKIYNGIDIFSSVEKVLIAPFVKRWSPYTLKLAMLMQLMKDKTVDKIDSSSINAAIWTVYYAFVSSKWLIKNCMIDSKEEKEMNKVHEYIANKNGKITFLQLQRSKTIRRKPSEKYKKILKTLE